MTTPQTPRSLEFFDRHQLAYYERLQQEVPYFTKIAPLVERFLMQIVHDGAFYIRVPMADLPAILESGRLLSCVETHHGATGGGEKVRREVTEALFGCKTAQLQPADFPKYGFLSQPDAKKDLYVNGQMWCQYGDVSIQLKKERLFHRTTLTVGDSVNFGRCYTMIPTRVDHVKATCVCGLQHDGKALMAPPEPILCYYLLASWIADRKLTPANFPTLEAVAKDAPPVFEFFELQYHGSLLLAEDVERIDVSPADEEERKTLEALRPKAEALGVPLYID